MSPFSKNEIICYNRELSPFLNSWFSKPGSFSSKLNFEGLQFCSSLACDAFLTPSLPSNIVHQCLTLVQINLIPALLPIKLLSTWPKLTWFFSYLSYHKIGNPLYIGSIKDLRVISYWRIQTSEGHSIV